MSLQEYDFKKIAVFFSFILIIAGGTIGASAALYYRNQYDKVQKNFREASVVNQQDVQTLVAKVGKLRHRSGQTQESAFLRQSQSRR